jgi:DNA (cytosine-5)-methyltransferase 1
MGASGIATKEVVAISLFSGAGGLDIASFMAGVPVVASTDFDSDCIQTLRQNEQFDGTTIIEGDLHEIERKVFKDIAKKQKGKKTIVIGGAPCQPFSKAGYWVGNDTRRGINDPRATLVDEYLRVVTDVSPDGFVFENVESLLHPTNKSIVSKFLEIVTKLGYKYVVVRANALDYGVPQKRKRIFIIGTKGDFKGDAPAKTHCAAEAADSTGLKPFVTVGEVISDFGGDEFFEESEVTKGGTYHDDLRQVPPGMNYKALTAWYGYENPKFVADKRFWSFLLKLSPTEPSWTITAQPGPWVGPFHWDNRRLRAPEIAAIQSFPKGYKFFGNRRSVQKQIGNAVPPLMGKAMIEFVKESLL